MRDAFYLELDRPVGRLEVFQFDADELRDELRQTGAKSPIELTDLGDCHVFTTEDAADEFLETYLHFYDQLPRRAKYPNAPYILLKRRYLVLVLMGLKDHTFRPYRKNWAPGDIFNFHDQIYKLSVRLLKLSETEDGSYRYDFEIA